jgi:sugar lactone lactonase YvrE
MGVRRAFVLSMVSVLASACGAGTAAIAGSGGGSTATVEKAPTTATAATPEDGQGGRVVLRVFAGVDASEGLRLESVELSPGPAEPFRPATVVAGFPGDLAPGVAVSGAEVAARDGEPFAIVWNAAHDFDAMLEDGTLAFPATARCRVRVRIANTVTGQVVTSTTDEFFVDQSLVSTQAGGGVGDGPEAAMAAMLEPADVALSDDRTLYVADSGNHRVRRIRIEASVAEEVGTVAGNGFAGVVPGLQPAGSTSMSRPVAVVADGDGNLFVAENDDAPDGIGGVVRRLDAESGLLTVLDDDLVLPFDLVDPVALAFLPSEDGPSGSDVLFVADPGTDTLWRVSIDGPPQLPVGPFSVSLVQPGGGRIQDPVDLAIDRSVPGQERVWVLEDSGLVHDLVVGGASTLLVAPPDAAAIAVDAKHLYLAFAGPTPQIAVFERPSFSLVNSVQHALIQDPSGMALDSVGRLYVVDEGDGMVVTGASGHLLLAVDSPADPANAIVRALAADGSFKEVTQELPGSSTQSFDVDDIILPDS